MAISEFGLFFEIPVPEPYTKEKEHAAFKETVEQCVLADRLGYHHFWCVEHHFLKEFSHSSAPESLFPYIAARTENIRIGHGVRLLPYPYNHPIRVAEQTATLDLLCDGRLEFGTGRSLSFDEFSGFGIDPGDARTMWEESLEMIVGCWTAEDTFEYEGKHFQMPPRRVIPTPLQQPHPPIWVAATGPESHQAAGEKGLGLLSLTLATPLDEVASRVAMYREAIKSANPIGKFVNNRTGTFAMVHVAETNEEARANCADAFVWYLVTGLKLASSLITRSPTMNPLRAGEGPNDDGPVASYEYLLKMMTDFGPSQLTFDFLLDNHMLICGDPDSVAEQVQVYSDVTGIDSLFCMMQVHDIPFEKTRRSIELFAEHVMPRFKKS